MAVVLLEHDQLVDAFVLAPPAGRRGGEGGGADGDALEVDFEEVVRAVAKGGALGVELGAMCVWGGWVVTADSALMTFVSFMSRYESESLTSSLRANCGREGRRWRTTSFAFTTSSSSILRCFLFGFEATTTTTAKMAKAMSTALRMTIDTRIKK
jgi:hypothetical protein